MRRLAVMLLLAAVARAEEWPYPAGVSEHRLEGLKTALHLPEDLSKEKPASLVVLLHGAGDNGRNLIGALREWPEQGYVILAPSATSQSWSATDVQAALRIAGHIKKVLPIDPERIHAVGFSNGGWNLHPVAFSDDLKCRSATWIAAGFRGGSVPRWAKKHLCALALAGANDPNAAAAAGTVPALDGKVKLAEARFEKGLGHKWPHTHDAYLKWFVGAAEGRFVPGEDLNFDYADNAEEPLEKLQGQKKGGVLIYYFHPDDKDQPEAKKLQNEVLMDPLVRHYGKQIHAVKMQFDEDAAQYGVKQSPAVVVLDRTGKVKKALQGKIKAKALASALRSVAPNKKRPKR